MSETPATPLPSDALPAAAIPEPAADAQAGAEAVGDATAEAAPTPAASDAAEPAAEAAAPHTPDGPDTPDTPDTPAQPPAPREPGIADLSPAACAALLAERFPALFAAGRPLPIKLRIQADIQQRAPGVFNKKSLSVFLHRHTTITAYIKALLAAPHRFDLDGQPAGEIAQEHRDAAVAEIERRLAIVQARRVAEREAQRQAAMARRGAPTAPVAPGAAAAEGAAAEGAPRQPRPDRPPRAREA